jgi:CBS domain-containing protein
MPAVVLSRANALPIRSVMTRAVSALHPEHSLHDAMRIMHSRDVGCIPIVDRQRAVVGIVTDRDVMLAALQERQPLALIPIAAAMTREPVTIGVEDTVEEAARLMRTLQVRRLPVTDERNRLLGILSLSDLVRVVAHLRRSGDDVASADALVETLAAIVEQRGPDSVCVVCSA